ncbi:MAG: PEP-CTERM sorting domain-containing protein [Bryobacteraceae bacterium]
MMKKVTVLLGMSALCFAGSFQIDDFSTDQGPISTAVVPDTVTDGPTGIGGTITRELVLNTLAALLPPEFTVQVSFGTLDITNGSGDDSQVRVIYEIPAIMIPAGATNVGLFLEIVQSDGNPTDVMVSGTAGASGSFFIPGNTMNQIVHFNIPAASFGPGSIILEFDGAPGWDLTVDSLGVNWDDPSRVPEPGTTALLGLGLAAVAFVRRSRA